MATYDAIVVGVGGMGSAALWHLARRGLRVLGIEPNGIAHDRGSSHGGSRLIRKAYFEHPDYVPLVTRAYALWRELEEASGRALFHRTGLLLVGPERGAVIAGVRQAADVHRLAIEDVDREGWSARFPGFAPSDEMTVLYEPDAGFLAVEECVRAHVEQAVAAGATVAVGERVLDWSADGDGVCVRTEGGRYSARHVVFCGGAWTGELLSAMGLPLEVRRKVVVWFDTTGGAYDIRAGSPVFCFDTPEGFFYGFPSMDGRTVKVGEHTGGQPVARVEALDRSLHEDDLVPLRRFIVKHMPEARPKAAKHSVCMYTMTPDEHFIVDRHPAYGTVVFACGFSGHGFKFASVIGSVLADLVAAGRTDEPIGFLGMSRFNK